MTKLLEVTALKIGFIGAGKVGCSLAKYFAIHGLSVTGFFSKTTASAQEAAQFTESNFYPSTEALIADSDMIFLTVTDGAIQTVWDSIKGEALTGKIICHCSGSLSSGIFSDIQQYGAYGYSIHPLYAIPSKTTSYKDLAHTMFTLEGDATYLPQIQSLLEALGNSVQVIATESKAKYHAAAVFASNHMLALAKVATDLLKDCGFTDETALTAITPLMEGNLAHLVSDGPVSALTGPVERADVTTISRHLGCLPEDMVPLYKELSKILVQLGKEKHPKTDYSALEKLL